MLTWQYGEVQDPGQDAAAARYADAVAILPAYARGIATELRALWIRPEELPADAESPLPLDTIRSLPQTAKAVDSAVLDAVLCRALKVGSIIRNGFRRYLSHTNWLS